MGLSHRASHTPLRTTLSCDSYRRTTVAGRASRTTTVHGVTLPRTISLTGSSASPLTSRVTISLTTSQASPGMTRLIVVVQHGTVGRGPRAACGGVPGSYTRDKSGPPLPPPRRTGNSSSPAPRLLSTLLHPVHSLPAAPGQERRSEACSVRVRERDHHAGVREADD